MAQSVSYLVFKSECLSASALVYLYLAICECSVGFLDQAPQHSLGIFFNLLEVQLIQLKLFDKLMSEPFALINRTVELVRAEAHDRFRLALGHAQQQLSERLAVLRLRSGHYAWLLLLSWLLALLAVALPLLRLALLAHELAMACGMR